MPENEARSSAAVWLSPAGAVIAAICFFLPWVKLSCTPEPWTGAQLGGIVWLVLVAAIAIMVVVPLYKSRGRAGDARLIVVISALVGLGVMAYKALQIFVWAKKDFTAQVESGAIGSALGLLIALAGVGALRNEPQVEVGAPAVCPQCKRVIPPEERGGSCSACGAALIGAG